MENQHRKIKDYGELNEEQIYYINSLKQIEDQVYGLLDLALSQFGADPRRTAVAKTNLETGFMYAIKATARPKDAK